MHAKTWPAPLDLSFRIDAVLHLQASIFSRLGEDLQVFQTVSRAQTRFFLPPRIKVPNFAFCDFLLLLVVIEQGVSMRCAPVVFLLSLVALAGCSPSNPRKAVSGTVTLHDLNLDEGTITFRPIPGTTPEGLPTTTGGAVITNGAYQIEAESGLVPGKYKVLITSGDGRTPDDPNEAPGPSGNFVSKDRIPPEYNTKSNVEVEVMEDGENVFDFPIP